MILFKTRIMLPGESALKLAIQLLSQIVRKQKLYQHYYGVRPWRRALRVHQEQHDERKGVPFGPLLNP